MSDMPERLNRQSFASIARFVTLLGTLPVLFFLALDWPSMTTLGLVQPLLCLAYLLCFERMLAHVGVGQFARAANLGWILALVLILGGLGERMSISASTSTNAGDAIDQLSNLATTVQRRMRWMELLLGFAGMSVGAFTFSLRLNAEADSELQGII